MIYQQEYKKKHIFFVLLTLVFTTICSAQSFVVGDHIMFKAYDWENAFLRHYGGNAMVSVIDSENCKTLAFWDAVYIVEEGLSNLGEGYYSFRSANIPNHYLRHIKGDIIISPKENTDLFRKDATWKLNEGIVDSSVVSFTTSQWNTIYKRHKASNVMISEIKSYQDQKDATWEIKVRNDLKYNSNCAPISPPGVPVEKQIKTICGTQSTPIGWAQIGWGPKCHEQNQVTYYTKIIRKIDVLENGKTINICGVDDIPAGWVQIGWDGNCGNVGNTTYNNKTIKRIDGMENGAEINICGIGDIPNGWVQIGWGGNCGVVGNVTYNVKTIKRIDGMPSGTTINICGISLVPEGWREYRTNIICKQIGIKSYKLRTITKL